VTRRRHIIASEEGQSAVEFALMSPFIVALLFMVIEFAVAFHDYVTLTDAARAGARRAIIARFNGGSFADATQAVKDAAGNLSQSQLSQPGAIDVSDPDGMTAGSLVTVTVKYPYAISIPLLGLNLSSGTLTAVAKERLE
jgi:Flp pilus assembly protein TadG